ncbi:MAG: hypothetical protein M1150_00425 [Patescibacteria group bacterium]|nr:hypothetical protein [Patescibacteria group bacterium]
MKIFNQKRDLSKIYLLIAFLWSLSVEVAPTFGGERTFGSFLTIIPVYLILSLVFYFLYKFFNQWLVITFGALLGLVMEFSFMRPEEIPFGNIHNQQFLAGIFFLLAWSVITGVPYFIFLWSNKSKRNFLVALIIPLLVLSLIVFKLAT